MRSSTMSVNFATVPVVGYRLEGTQRVFFQLEEGIGRRIRRRAWRPSFDC